MKGNVKFIFFLFFSFNLFYFSLSAFSYVLTEGKSHLYSLQYNRFIDEIKVRPLFNLLKVNLAFLFFGKGLYASSFLEYSYYEAQHDKLYTRSISDGFSSPNARVRAATLSTRLSIICVDPIERLKRNLNDRDNKVNGELSKDSILRTIEKKEIILKDILFQAGNFLREQNVITRCFEAKFYYVFPNSVENHELTTRKLYNIASYQFCNE